MWQEPAFSWCLKTPFFCLWSMSVFPWLIHKGDIVLNKYTACGYFWICTFLTLLIINDSLGMPWDNLKTVHVVTKETLWQEYRIFFKKIYYYFYFGEPSFFVYWWRWICSPECHKWLLITRVHACAEEIIVFCCFPKNITLAFLRMDWHFSTCFRHSWSYLVINLEDVVMSISPSLCLSSFLIISSVWNKIWVIG